MDCYKRIITRGLGIFILFLLVLFVFRKPLLRSIANFLICENISSESLPVFVLSGSAFDRGNKAFELYTSGKARTICCTGINQAGDLKAMNINISEGLVTMKHLANMGVADSLLTYIPLGTSTIEESEAIMDYCKQKRWKKITILSSRFHTRRIHFVFNQKFSDNGIEICICGAPSSSYNENNWWTNEDGLIAVNNEYIKLLYYMIKY